MNSPYWHMIAFCPVSAAHVPNIFAHTLYVLFVQENVGALYSNILSKKASHWVSV